MALFDIFKKKTSVSEAATEATTVRADGRDVSAAAGKEALDAGLEKNRHALDSGLEKTRQGLFSRLTRAVAGRSTVDADMLDELEEILITSDVGVDTTVEIIRRIEARVARDKYMNAAELQSILRE
ncbi:MAG: signal recognition particle receptor subunit alpha, partial [Alistipes sp.]|nr:signal recognition particle receptor subunit alpha [Alistipes sp.]